MNKLTEEAREAIDDALDEAQARINLAVSDLQERIGSDWELDLHINYAEAQAMGERRPSYWLTGVVLTAARRAGRVE